MIVSIATGSACLPLPHLAAGLVEHLLADRDDQPALLGCGDEVSRADDDTVRPAPAHQRLDASDAPVCVPDHGLVLEEELAAGQSAAEGGGHLDAVQRAVPHPCLEELDEAPTRRLRLVHGEIGPPHQVLAGHAWSGADRDAHARRDRHFGAVDADRTADGVGHPPSELGRGSFAHALDNDGELVTSGPSRRIRRPQHGGQAGGNLAEHPIAAGVPIAVVDGLEVVDVDDHHRDRFAVPASPRHRLLETVVEEGTIGETGERVVEGALPELDLETPLLGDVPRGDEPDEVAVHLQVVGGDVDLDHRSTYLEP